jgi:hypothetical protein
MLSPGWWPLLAIVWGVAAPRVPALVATRDVVLLWKPTQEVVSMADSTSREPEEPRPAAGVTSIEDTEATRLNRVITRPMLTFFILGDILGAGIYALTGQVAGDVGGAIWASFLVSFLLALVTAFAYLELVTKYPRAAGAALYVHRAYHINILTFLGTVAVMASGVTSASFAATRSAAATSPGCSGWRTPRPCSSRSSSSCWWPR